MVPFPSASTSLIMSLQLGLRRVLAQRAHHGAQLLLASAAEANNPRNKKPAADSTSFLPNSEDVLVTSLLRGDGSIAILVEQGEGLLELCDLAPAHEILDIDLTGSNQHEHLRRNLWIRLLSQLVGHGELWRMRRLLGPANLSS